MHPTWLTWLNSDDHGQLLWAKQYLARKGYPGFFPAHGYPLDGAAFIEAIAGYEQDPAFRYVVNKMRAAWRQKQYRAQNGQQVTFQLPHRVRSDLARLSKARSLTKVETLRQVITDAANQHGYEREELKKIKEKHKKAFHELKSKHAQEVRVLHGLSAYLLKILSEEIHQRCRLEALVGELGDSSLDDTSMDDYHILVTKRVAEVEAAHPNLKLVRPGGSTLNQRMQSLADMKAPWHATGAMQTHWDKDPC